MALPQPRATFNYYLQVQEDLNYEMRRVLLRASSQIERDVLKISGDGIGAQIRSEQLMAVKRSLHERLAVLYDDAGYVVQSNRQKAAAAAIDAFQAYERVLLANVPNLNVAAYMESARITSKAGVDAVMRRVMGKSYRPLATSVYHSEKLARGIVDRMVEDALAKGLSARELAANARALINPNVRGGVSYAANRLARTEINNAFHAVSQDKYRESGIVTGVDWNLSGAHPEGDECDDLAANSPYDPRKIPEKPHPMCFCYVTPQVPDEDEFLRAFHAGEYGNEPWTDDDFYTDRDMEFRPATVAVPQQFVPRDASEFDREWPELDINGSVSRVDSVYSVDKAMRESLSVAEREAISKYASGEYFFEIKEAYLSGSPYHLSDGTSLFSALESAISKSTLKHDTKLFRALRVDSSWVDSLAEGSRIDHKFFISTTTNNSQATSYGVAKKVRGQKPVLLEILAPAGTNASPGMTAIQEVILSPDTKMRVRSVKNLGKNTLVTVDIV